MTYENVRRHNPSAQAGFKMVSLNWFRTIPSNAMTVQHL
jgi:hypothetical protein